MAFSTTWDLDKYKSEFESEEQWQLRKKFMQAHKHKFPEDKLVCLARVFFNVEFLGCRYPEKTMRLVAELSKGVADDYREKQKGKLKRTFVQASDAAGAKVKGKGATPPSKITEGPPSKAPKTSDCNPSSAGFKYTCFVHEDLVKPPPLPEGEFPGFIIYESCKTNCPVNILTQSAQKSKVWNVISFNFPAEKNTTSNTERYCEITLKNKALSSGVGLTNKEAKVNAAIEGLNKLRQTCYTIQEKLSFFSDGELVSKEQVVKGKEKPIPLPQDNIGSRMMMKMGWTGSGLGKNQQGIKAPIEASQTMHRAGFGNLSTPQFHSKFRNVFKDYIASGSTNDLVFAPDFSAEERKILHRLAQNMNLKTKSYGKNEQRHLVVYKVMTLTEIVETLLQCGGENEKYSLLHPLGEDSSNSSASSSLVIVDQENPNVSVKTSPTDGTKDNTIRLMLKSNSEQQNFSQRLEVFEEKSGIPCESSSCALKTTSENKDFKSENVPEIMVLRIDSQDKAQDFEKRKWNVADCSKSEAQNVTNYKDDESDIDVIDRVISIKKKEIASIQTKFEELLAVYKRKQEFTKKQRKKYILFRGILQNITGTFILNVLRPDWTIENWKNGKIPKKGSLNNFKARCEAAGLAEVEHNINLKREIMCNLKKRLKTDKLLENRHTRRAIKLECQRLGSKLVSDFLYIEKDKPIHEVKPKKNTEAKGWPINRHKVNNKSKQNVPKKTKKLPNVPKKTKKLPNMPRKTKKLPDKTKKIINFVKESGFSFGDESSGMEYSDMEDMESELDD